MLLSMFVKCRVGSIELKIVIVCSCLAVRFQVKYSHPQNSLYLWVFVSSSSIIALIEKNSPVSIMCRGLSSWVEVVSSSNSKFLSITGPLPTFMLRVLYN